ncbi:MAG TPA: TonB-dependent receptor, partial [Chloroflexota bacterium]
MRRDDYCGLVVVLTAGVSALPIAAGAAGVTTSQAAPAPPADQQDAADDSASTVGEVDVIASRDYAHQVGAVISPVLPEIQYNPAQIQSLGVNTVSELLDELLPETRSDRGRGHEAPIVLLNGRRISSLSDVINLPTEAILRVDILPEEAALSYGYPADQRVVNIVLRRHFHAVVAGLAGGGATDSGQVSGQAEADLLRVHHNTRLNLDLKYKGASEITDASRGIIEPAPSEPFDLVGNVVSPTAGAEIDPALSALAGRPVTVAGVPAVAQTQAPTLNDFAATAGAANVTNTSHSRTLAPASQMLTGNAVLAGHAFAGFDATLNASFSVSTSDSLHGLPSLKLLVPAADPFSPFASDVVVDRYVDAPLRQFAHGWTGHLGAVLNKNGRDWGFSFTGGYDHVDTRVETDTGIDATTLQSLLNNKSASFNPFAPLPGGLLDFRPRNRAHLLSDSTNLQALA